MCVCVCVCVCVCSRDFSSRSSCRLLVPFHCFLLSPPLVSSYLLSFLPFVQFYFLSLPPLLFCFLSSPCYLPLLLFISSPCFLRFLHFYVIFLFLFLLPFSSSSYSPPFASFYFFSLRPHFPFCPFFLFLHLLSLLPLSSSPSFLLFYPCSLLSTPSCSLVPLSFISSLPSLVISSSSSHFLLLSTFISPSFLLSFTSSSSSPLI